MTSIISSHLSPTAELIRQANISRAQADEAATAMGSGDNDAGYDNTKSVAMFQRWDTDITEKTEIQKDNTLLKSRIQNMYNKVNRLQKISSQINSEIGSLRSNQPEIDRGFPVRLQQMISEIKGLIGEDFNGYYPFSGTATNIPTDPFNYQGNTDTKTYYSKHSTSFVMNINGNSTGIQELVDVMNKLSMANYSNPADPNLLQADVANQQANRDLIALKTELAGMLKGIDETNDTLKEEINELRENQLKNNYRSMQQLFMEKIQQQTSLDIIQSLIVSSFRDTQKFLESF